MKEEYKKQCQEYGKVLYGFRKDVPSWHTQVFCYKMTKSRPLEMEDKQKISDSTTLHSFSIVILL